MKLTQSYIVSLCTVSVACSPVPKSICDMPSNSHFWQGAKVSWTGDIVDISSFEGSVTDFWDKRCGRNIRIDIYGNLQPSNTALAHAQVTGRIVFSDGRFKLRPESIRLLSAWLSDEALDEYMAREIELRRPGGPREHVIEQVF